MNLVKHLIPIKGQDGKPTRKNTPFIINCLAYLLCDELPDCPCENLDRYCKDKQMFYLNNDSGMYEETTDYCTATHFMGTLVHKCCDEGINIPFVASTNLAIGDGVYLPDNQPFDESNPQPIDTTPASNDPSNGSLWGYVSGTHESGIGRYAELGSDNQLQVGDIGNGGVYATMNSDKACCCGLDIPEPAPEPVVIELVDGDVNDAAATAPTGSIITNVTNNGGVTTSYTVIDGNAVQTGYWHDEFTYTDSQRGNLGLGWNPFDDGTSINDRVEIAPVSIHALPNPTNLPVIYTVGVDMHSQIDIETDNLRFVVYPQYSLDGSTWNNAGHVIYNRGEIITWDSWSNRHITVEAPPSGGTNIYFRIMGYWTNSPGTPGASPSNRDRVLTSFLELSINTNGMVI